ncbi:hypothetical protein AB0J35_55540 [Nonomuraea angiospora]|uniref:hypothetical protein n=1 Tax=Nonomuraea angiospora TaxID=46172 RepID=UPI0034367908
MVTAFVLANPKLYGEREAVLLMLAEPKNQPEPGTIDVCDKGFAGKDFEHAPLEEFGVTGSRDSTRQYWR